MKKRILSTILTLCLIIALIPSLTPQVTAATNHTQDEAVAWICARKAEGWAKNYDGSAYQVPQCVDLIAYYLDYLGASQLKGGNGYAYADKDVSACGWSYQASPQPGDIAVWKAYQGMAREDGHVALVESVSGSRFNYIDVNGATGKAGSGNIATSDASTFIRPDFTPRPKAPNKPTVKVNGAAVTVSWNDVANETSYNVYLVQAPWSWEDIKYQGSVSANKTSYTFDTVKPGVYKAFVISMPNGAEVQSEWTEFTVVWPKPTNQPIATVVGRDVTISWNNVSDEVSYNIYLVQSPWSWEDIKYKGSVAKDVTKYTFSNVAPGEYKAFVISMPNGAETQSPWVSLTVPTQNVSTEVSSITLNKSSLSLKTGESATLSATVQSNNPKDVTVTWSSSNTKVATVSGGKVTAVAAGTATITAKAGNKTATCTVTVSNATVEVTGISLNKTSLSLSTGESATLTATVSPSNATDKTVTWSSSNTKIVTVSNGKVTAVAAGTATITAKAGNKSATCTVTVSNATVAVTGISLNSTSISLATGASTTLTATVSPSNATDKTVTWSSSNTKIATVSGGKVTAVAAGTATITAKAGNKSATCKVTVTSSSVAVTSISLNQTSLTLSSGDTAALTATISPNNATDKNIVWTSDNEAVATVYNGVVTAVSAGTTIIRAQAGGKSTSCNITVTGEAKEYQFEIGAYVDGEYEVNFGYYGVVDVYINGALVAPSVGMYFASLPAGATYEIKNIANNRNGYKYDGVYDGSLKGTISADNVKVTLKFVKENAVAAYEEPTIAGKVSVVQENGLKLDNLTYTYNAGGREAEDNPGVVGSFSISFTVNGEESICKVRGYAPRNSNPTENEINTLATQQAAKGKQESGFNTANADGKPPFRGGIGTKPVTAADLDATRYVIVLGFDKNTDVVGYVVLKVVVGATTDEVFSGSVQPDAAELPSTWAQAEVSTAIDAGLVPKNLQQNYTKPVSRADVAQMFINLIEQSSGKSVERLMNEKGVSINKDAFTDTSDYAVLAANALGIINGMGNSQFSPDGTFTRSQIAAIINRVARVLGVNTDGYTHSFTDVVGHWVDTELGWPSSVGIINGVGNNQFSPDTDLTTEQAIAITYRALQILR